MDSRELAGEECLEIKGEKNMFFVIPEDFVRCKPNLLHRILKTEKIKSHFVLVPLADPYRQKYH